MIDRVANQSLNRNLRKILTIIALPGLLLCLSCAIAEPLWQEADLEWKLKRDRNGIQVFLSKVPGSRFRAVMSVMEIQAKPKELAALVTDLDSCPNWAAMCKSAKIVERISASESVVYSVNDAPFPVRDRDIVAHVKWRYDPTNGKISMRSSAKPDGLPKKKGAIRVQYASSEWHFTPKGDDRVLVESYAHVDPNGKVPAWLINLLIVESPYKTMKNMRKLILKGDYRDAEVAFIPSSNSATGDDVNSGTDLGKVRSELGDTPNVRSKVN